MKWSSFSPPWRTTGHMSAGIGIRAGIWHATSSGPGPRGSSSRNPMPLRHDWFRQEHRRDVARVVRIRLGCAAASSAVSVFVVIIIGSLTPVYSHWSDPVSRLASPGEPWSLEARAAFAAYGLLV